MPKEKSREPRLYMKELKKETMHNFVIMLTTAFGLVAALAWNTAIQAAFTRFFGAQSTVLAMFGYATAVTVVAVVVVTYLSKLEVKEELRK